VCECVCDMKNTLTHTYTCAYTPVSLHEQLALSHIRTYTTHTYKNIHMLTHAYIHCTPVSLHEQFVLFLLERSHVLQLCSVCSVCECVYICVCVCMCVYVR
jgi:hypothetical protein